MFMFFLYRRFLRWSGLNRSTSLHIRIRGCVLWRFLVSSIFGTIGFGLISLGIFMEPNGWDITTFLVGVLFFFFGMRIMRPWLFGENQ